MRLVADIQEAAAMEAAVLRGLQQAKQQQTQGLQLQPQQLCLQDFHTVLAGSSTDALLQELPTSLTQLSLNNTFSAAPCNVSSSTLAAFTRLRSLSVSLSVGQLLPTLDRLTALQQLQALAIITNNEEEAVLLQQCLPQKLQHFTLLCWPGGGGEWRETWPLLQLQQLTGVRIHMLVAGTIIIIHRATCTAQSVLEQQALRVLGVPQACMRWQVTSIPCNHAQHKHSELT
jgi:hypothetical protein